LYLAAGWDIATPETSAVSESRPVIHTLGSPYYGLVPPTNLTTTPTPAAGRRRSIP